MIDVTPEQKSSSRVSARRIHHGRGKKQPDGRRWLRGGSESRGEKSEVSDYSSDALGAPGRCLQQRKPLLLSPHFAMPFGDANGCWTPHNGQDTAPGCLVALHTRIPNCDSSNGAVAWLVVDSLPCGGTKVPDTEGLRRRGILGTRVRNPRRSVVGRVKSGCVFSMYSRGEL